MGLKMAFRHVWPIPDPVCEVAETGEKTHTHTERAARKDSDSDWLNASD